MNSIKHLVVIALFTASSTAYAAFSQVISIGDSLSDTGNIFTATGGDTPPSSAGYNNGRFTNGLVWNELLAANFGVAAPTPSLLGGTNGAFGGARTTTTASGFIPSAVDQAIGATANYTAVDPNALYTVFIGGNDVNAASNAVQAAFTAELASSGDPVAATLAAQAEAAIQSVGLALDGAAAAQIAVDLVNAGAENVLLFNVPNVALAPIAGGDPLGVVDALTSAFNFGLGGAAGIASPNIAFIDAFAILSDIVTNPAAFGLTEVVAPCLDLNAGTLCSDPSSYLFFDDLHPTNTGHQIIADAAILAASTLPAAVPVPAAFPLFLSAIAALGWARRKTA